MALLCRNWQGFSALQRAEIAEIDDLETPVRVSKCFSALQRAEIAEIHISPARRARQRSFSALQRAEIAEIIPPRQVTLDEVEFQCSSTSRNC